MRWVWRSAVSETGGQIGVQVELGSHCVKALPFQLLVWKKQLREYRNVSPSAHVGYIWKLLLLVTNSGVAEAQDSSHLILISVSQNYVKIPDLILWRAGSLFSSVSFWVGSQLQVLLVFQVQISSKSRNIVKTAKFYLVHCQNHVRMQSINQQRITQNC